MRPTKQVKFTDQFIRGLKATGVEHAFGDSGSKGLRVFVGRVGPASRRDRRRTACDRQRERARVAQHLAGLRDRTTEQFVMVITSYGTKFAYAFDHQQHGDFQ